MSLRNFATIEQRRSYLQNLRKLQLKTIRIYPKGLETAAARNCENMIGAVQIPLGVAGPLKISGEFAKSEFYLPLATTEGALVASVNRGCKAVSLSGGAKVRVENVGITRGPVFKTSGIAEGLWLKKWLDDSFVEVAKAAKATSSHLKLLRFDVLPVGRNVFVRFYFDTGDAMGMNMVTLASQKIVDFIEKETKIRCLALAGNFDIDKKPAWLNFVGGRGKKVWAEAVLGEKVVRDILKTTPSKIHETAISKCFLGSIVSGSLGFNAHFANIIAAIFIACGQDPAHTVEGSMGIVSTQIDNRQLYISVYLPDLPIGTVGGGTYLPSQQEMLKLLGVSGGNHGRNALKFAEIVGAAVLAGELSLLASLSEGSLARAHQKLAREK